MRPSYFRTLRLNFVLFYFFVVGEAIYRRDGFMYYYASFADFIPTFALVTIFWSVIAVLAGSVLWISCSIFEWLSHRMGWKGKYDHALSFVGIFTFLGATVWTVKKQAMSRGTSFEEKVIVLLCVSFMALFLVWMCRNKVERWLEIIQMWIDSLSKLLGVSIILAVAIIIYCVW